jgi:LysM domain
MSVLAGWQPSPIPSRTPLPICPYRPAARPRWGPARHPARYPVGLAVVPPPRPPATTCSPKHIRRRLIALLIVGLVAAVAVVGLALLRTAAVDDGIPERTTVVEVRQGETLWELAERVVPQSPPHAVVERIKELNGLRGSTVHPGQPLLVPDSG